MVDLTGPVSCASRNLRNDVTCHRYQGREWLMDRFVNSNKILYNRMDYKLVQKKWATFSKTIILAASASWSYPWTEG